MIRKHQRLIIHEISSNISSKHISVSNLNNLHEVHSKHFLNPNCFLSCKKDAIIEDNNPFNLEPEIGTMSDIDGNNYNTIKVGEQWWMKENFRSTKYNDGSPISNINTTSEWVIITHGAFCNYGYDISSSDTIGLLDNYYGIEGGKLCPEGCRIPTNEDYRILLNYIDSTLQFSNECDVLRSYSGWETDNFDFNANGTDLVGFKALSVGYLSLSVRFWGKGKWTMFWSKSYPEKEDSSHVYVLKLSPYNTSIIENGLYTKTAMVKIVGISIRLIKE